MFDEDPPRVKDRQPPYPNMEERDLVKAKLEKVLDRGYVVLRDIEEVESLMFMFHVPKGDSDVRMVYDGTKSGLNDALYAPWFALPTVDTMTRWVIAGTWLADNDYGDCFLNYPLHPDLQKFCGIDLSQLFPDLTRLEAQLLVGVWI